MPISIAETIEAMKHDKKMENRFHGNEPIDRCRNLAAKRLGVSIESTYVVMFSFVLGGFKAFCSSSEIHDERGHYVEVVYDGLKERYYVVHYEETYRSVEYDN